MRVELEINESKASFFMELIKNLNFIKLVKTTKVGGRSNAAKGINNGKNNDKDKKASIEMPTYAALDYDKYHFHTADLKFDRNEINERN